MKNRAHYIIALFAIAFGLLTIKTGATFLFTEAGQIAAGNYVPFVLWFNFIAGFIYVAAAVGIFLKKYWSYTLARILAISTFLVAIAFTGHVFMGGAYEVKTAGAIVLRTSFWVVISFLLPKFVFKKDSK